MDGEKKKDGRGGARAGAGRPAKTEGKRDRNIGIRVSEAELTMLKEKADGAGKGLTEFILDLVKNA